MVLAEGAAEGLGAPTISEKLEQLTGEHWRYVVLGYIQRGGSPTAADRVLATKISAYCVDSFANGKSNIMIGVIDKKLAETQLVTVYTEKKPLDSYLLDLVSVIT